MEVGRQPWADSGCRTGRSHAEDDEIAERFYPRLLHWPMAFRHQAGQQGRYRIGLVDHGHDGL
ncbi:hypothetical protein, partial [Thauera butanivorans]|uniref:hypothetical protein n=1 Tax=Thauera butanivorans TaxID=86174 RepID=UPI001C3F1C95